MAPSTRCDPTKVLKHVCEILKLPSPKYIPIPKGGGFLSFVKIKNHQYVGKISTGSLAEARATAASNALEMILKDNKDLKKDEMVQEYLARLAQDREVFDHQVREPSVLCMKYAEALMSMRDVKVGILLKAMKKQMNRAEREKFLSMCVEERYKWLESLE